MFSLNILTSRWASYSRRRALSWLLLVGACVAVICSGLSLDDAKAQEKGGGSQSAPAKPNPADKGDFKVAYVPPKNKAYLPYEAIFKESKLFEEISAGMNEAFILPYNIVLEFTECGEPNAFYDPETKKIALCYELIENSVTLFKDDKKTDDEFGEAVLGSTVWTYFHEVGHALVDVYDLPITGKEEDAVDQLSTYILTNFGEEGEQMALNGAREFYLEAQRDSNLDDSHFADVHSLNKQRFFNIICWVYGQNPTKFASLTKDGTLPEGRMDDCESEYQQIAKSWEKLLDAHVKD